MVDALASGASVRKERGSSNLLLSTILLRKAKPYYERQKMLKNIQVYDNDLPSNLQLKGALAIDCETMGLKTRRDNLCLLQIADEAGSAHLVRFLKRDQTPYLAPNLVALLKDESRLKIFHFARFDLAAIWHYLGVMAQPIYCTKIASRLARTYTDRHGLRDLCRELLGVDLSKQQQSSDWGDKTLTPQQIKYAASDVLHLHACRERLQDILIREGRDDFAQSCFEFLPWRVKLDLGGWDYEDIFAH